MFNIGSFNVEFLILWKQYRPPDLRAAGIDDWFLNYVPTLCLLIVVRDACDLSP